MAKEAIKFLSRNSTLYRLDKVGQDFMNDYVPLGIGLKSRIADRYEVFENFQSGPVSSTFGVIDLRNQDQRLVLELFSPAVTEDPVARERFFQEADFARKLRHPSILEVYEVGRTKEGSYYITAESVEAVSLETLLDYHAQQGSRFEETAYCLLQIAKGIAYAHRNRLLHRDLNPNNILVLSSGEVKIKNFGVSSVWYGEDCFSSPEAFVGNPFYCSPEEVAGKLLDERVDIYAIGVIGYELLTGKVPYQGRNSAQVFDRIIHEPFPELALNDPAIPTWLAELVNKATRKTPAERNQSVDEITEILESHIGENIEQHVIALATLIAAMKHQQIRPRERERMYLCPICKARLTNIEKAVVPKFLCQKRDFTCWRCGSALYWCKPAYSKINIGFVSLVIGVIIVLLVGFGSAMTWGLNALLLGCIGLFQAVAGAIVWADGMQTVTVVLE